MIEILVLMYFLTGFFVSGLVYANNQREFPMLADEDRLADSLASMMAVVIGPFSILAFLVAFGTFKHGWKMPFTK